jgi:hypothetical protein
MAGQGFLPRPLANDQALAEQSLMSCEDGWGEMETSIYILVFFLGGKELVDAIELVVKYYYYSSRIYGVLDYG